MEINLPVNVKLNSKDDVWSAVVTRVEDEKTYPVMSLAGLSSSDVFVRFGIKVPEKEVQDPENEAKEVINGALKTVSTKTVYTAGEVQDVLLDALNKLGGKSIQEPQEETEDEDGDSEEPND